MSNFCRLLLAGALALVCATSFARTQQNSFLNRPANTVPDLVAQINDDRDVADRFMRHFGVSKPELVAMVSKLKLGRLQSDGVYLVYNVPGWEEVRSRAMFYRKGTLVWTDQNGSPVLKVSCGNPMVRGTDIGLSAVDTGVKLQPTMLYRDLVAEHTPETSFVDYSPVTLEPGTVQVLAADVLPTVPSVPAVSRAIVPGLIIPVVAGLFLGLNTGDTPPVPEPCTIVVTSVSATALLLKRRRASRS